MKKKFEVTLPDPKVIPFSCCVWVVQEETGGIPYEPLCFLSESKAELAFVQLVNENHHTKFKRFTAAARHAEKANERGDEYYIRMWEVEAS